MQNVRTSILAGQHVTLDVQKVRCKQGRGDADGM
jgi:hypothetical protein